MKKTLLLPALLLAIIINAQTKVSVAVQSFSFTPSIISITVGDTVEWTNVGGSHNVNGTQGTFSSNPVSFGNSVGSGWTYSFIFNTAGTYNFQCDPHAGAMNGTIDVRLATGVKEKSKKNVIPFYPNPVKEVLYLKDFQKVQQLTIFSVTGQLMLTVKPRNKQIDIATLPKGIYFIKIWNQQEETVSTLIIQ